MIPASYMFRDVFEDHWFRPAPQVAEAPEGSGRGPRDGLWARLAQQAGRLASHARQRQPRPATLARQGHRLA